MASDWLLDNNHRSDFEINESKVIFKHESDQCLHFNAMYLGICANKKNRKYYWEFECSSGGCSVGIAKKESFASGYGLKGVFFNGNLSDGGCLLIHEFGDDIKDGDRIGMILDLGENELKVYMVQNDRPLGLAFVHTAPYASELYPTISFTSPGYVEVKEKDVKNFENLLIRSDYPTRTIDGKFKLVKVIDESDEKNFREYQLSLKGDDKNNEKIHVSLRVINTIGCFLTKVGKDDEGDIWKTQGQISTLMAGNPEQMNNEIYLSNVLHNLKRIKFNNNFDEVTIISPKTTLHFERFLPIKKPHQSSTLLK